MTEISDVVNRKTLYDGRGLPVDALSPDEFENFVFSCLLCIQEILGLRIIGKPSGSGDGGFDVQGEVVASNRLACVQCKRQKEPLGASQAAKELAKVAATTALEGSDVGEHRFICTGGIRTVLAKQLREKSRQLLAVEAGEQLATSKSRELVTLRVRLEKSGADPRQVAESYVRGLDLLAAWGLPEFDAALSPRWDDVLPIIERHFSITTVVREYPRASFDRSAYISEHKKFRAVVEPRLSESSLPEAITASSAAAPSAVPVISTRKIKTLYELAELKPGELALLIGDGGVGKSTALQLIRAEILRTTPDSSLSIIISLVNYSPGSLDRAIHQELGVDQGTWRSLPDRVLLLCDGLNECPSANLQAFLDELKPLLKRCRVACIISTRELTKHKKVILAQQPVACVKVEGLTPIGIHRIAEHELKDQTPESFVNAYRSLADRSGSPLLWTPFAIMVALRVWRLTATLPSTLGEMLETLLQARCVRDAEFSEQSPGTEVILRLASSLAFQCLVVDRRLQCPAGEAGRCVREAKKYCADALGVSDMTEMHVVDLLARHELLQVSHSGHIGFGHQLLAGALAAPSLAHIWQDHMDSLGDPVADDAWIFAARLVPREHMKSFLTAAFDVDLILGAKTARELREEFHEIAESLLDRSFTDESPEIVKIQGMFALSRLGSPGAIARLRKFAKETGSPTHYAAQHALAATGDQEYLRELLPEVDSLRSCGIKVSGGNVGIWEDAPLPIRLDLARQRLAECNAGEPVAESLALLAFERDPSDAALAEKHLRAASHLAAWQSALYALHEISPIQAKEVVEESLREISNHSERAILMRSASLLGVDIDLRSAFDCAIVELSPDESADKPEFDLHQLISDVVTKSPLTPDQIAVIERELPSSSGERRNRLWQIASGCKSSFIADYAVSSIANWGPDLGNACNFFIAQPELTRAHRQQLVELCEKGFEDEQTWYGWYIWRALTLVGELGFTPKAAESLSAMIERLVRVQRATETNNIAALSPGDAEVLKSSDPEHLLRHLGRLAAQLIPAAAKARRFLADDVLLSLLHFETTHYNVVHDLREMLSDISDTDIDEVLKQLQHEWTRRTVLKTVCGRGPTEIRVKMLAQEIRHYYKHSSALNLVKEAIETCWCKQVCEMVAKTVAEIPTWSEYESQFFWGFVDAVAMRVGPDDQAIFEAEVSHARTDFARRILHLWRDYASGSRVGLARLSQSNE